MNTRRGPGASGRFVIRMAPGLHAALQSAARASGLSLNEYCVRRLSTPGPALALSEDAAALVARASAVAGEALVAVVVYGSWARGDATSTSDVDLLVVVEPRVGVTRALYRAWDEQPVTWVGRTVDPHFVHPPGDRVTGGLWGEVAIDGLVLLERGDAVSSHLARVRRAIAEGRLVRHLVHGQPYWTDAA